MAAGFQAVMAGFGSVDTPDEGLETLFHEIDADGSGSISEQEMAKAIDKLYGEPLKPQLVAQMMKAADTNNDGQIQLEEFKSIMRAGPPKAPSTSRPSRSRSTSWASAVTRQRASRTTRSPM